MNGEQGKPPGTTATRNHSNGTVIFVNGRLEKVLGLASYNEVEHCNIPCTVTTNRESMLAADAVVWNARWMDAFKHVPPKKPFGQRWVFNFFFESPIYNGQRVAKDVVSAVSQQADWTMTYSSRADIFDPWNRFVPRNASLDLEKPNRNYARGRQYLLLWLVSNCAAPRMKFFTQLQRLLPTDSVHIYGTCGKPSPCPGRNLADACYRELFSKYWFYAAFENQRCDGYITEKFFRGLLHGMVPIALGGFSRHDYASLGVPDYAYVNVDDYGSLAHLAERLINISRNDDLYNTFFKWKGRYEIQSREMVAAHSLCTLCRKLSTDSPKDETKKWKEEWWYRGTCRSPAPFV